jgi:hypothetical protein
VHSKYISSAPSIPSTFIYYIIASNSMVLEYLMIFPVCQLVIPVPRHTKSKHYIAPGESEVDQMPMTST